MLLRAEQQDRRIHGQDWRNVGVIYRIYRGIMASIPPIKKPNAAGNWEEAVGAGPPEIRQRILARLAHKPRRTRDRWEQRVEAAAANQPEGFSWANILLPDSPPPVVNVVPRRPPVGFNLPIQRAVAV
jgi:hypothetical protein